MRSHRMRSKSTSSESCLRVCHSIRIDFGVRRDYSHGGKSLPPILLTTPQTVLNLISAPPRRYWLHLEKGPGRYRSQTLLGQRFSSSLLQGWSRPAARLSDRMLISRHCYRRTIFPKSLSSSTARVPTLPPRTSRYCAAKPTCL